jgi:hypothetical protein
MYVAVKIVGLGVGGERMKISDKEVTLVFGLHLDEIAQCTEVVTQMKMTG